jgi:hypothetical protein
MNAGYPNGGLPPIASITSFDQLFSFSKDSPNLKPNSSDTSIPLGVFADLDALAAEAEKELSSTNPYLRFWNLALELDSEDESVIEFIVEECDVTFHNYENDRAKLESKFSKAEIVKLTSLLEWYALMQVGTIPKYKEKFEDVKQFLGINHCIEILIFKPISEELGGNRISLQELSNIICETCDESDVAIQGKSSFRKILNKVGDSLSDLISTERLLNNMECYFEFEDGDFIGEFLSDFDDLDEFSRLRWALFSSVASFHLQDCKEGITAKPGVWPTEIPLRLLSLLQMIDECLCHIQSGKPFKKKKSTDERKFSCGIPGVGVNLRDPIGKEFSQGIPATRRNLCYPLDLCKIKVPEMPNWMPNGGDSCYVSSTLWPLLVMAKREITQRIQFFQTPGNEDTAIFPNHPLRVKKARKDFFEMFSELAPHEPRIITVEQVNCFRESMQIAFPGRYMFPNRFSQEDAYEFLVCVMNDLLALNSCSQLSPKFQKFHTFIRSNEDPLLEPEKYEYEDALKSAYSPEPFFIDIRLDEGIVHAQTLKDLVTNARQTEEIDRHAYSRVQAAQGLKEFRPVKVKHTEQLLVESKEGAPEYFVGRLTRFSMDHDGVRSKRFDFILPSAFLDFRIRGQEHGLDTVSYDLTAITVHSGKTIDSGHYYTYFRKQVQGEWKFFKYDDLTGTEISQNVERVLEDAALNGYIFYYNKRSYDALPPTELVTGTELDIILRRIHEEKVNKEKEKEDGSASQNLKRPREEYEKSSDVGPSASSTPQKKQSLEYNLVEAREWVTFRLNASFFIGLEDRGYSSLEELFLHAFQLNPQIKDLNTRQFLSAASNALKQTIYLIDPAIDKELNVLDTFPIPSDLFRFGEKFSERSVLYLFKQRDGAYVIVHQKN